MAKHTLEILRCEHRKIFKVRLAILQLIQEGVKAAVFMGNFKEYYQTLILTNPFTIFSRKSEIHFSLSSVDYIFFLC